MKHTLQEAQENLKRLRTNEYPGRGIVIGTDETGHNLIQMYWIMGRSESSRGRILVLGESGQVTTELIDPSKAERPELLVYDAMLEDANRYAVSNGKQTDDALFCAGTLAGFLAPGFTEKWKFEPDAPTFTPRISAVCILEKGLYQATFSILRRSPFGDACDHSIHQYAPGSIASGLGYCVTTYEGNGNPLPSFEGTPYLLPLKGTAKEIAETFWEALDPENKISLAVKSIHLATGVSTIEMINKYQTVEAV